VEKKAPRQPRFVQPLQNAEITEGQRFTFECRLECDTKSPTIEWYKDNLAITSPDYATTYKDGLCHLTIEETFSEDSARYLCKAITEAGTAETFATLKVKETHQKILPPEFVKQLRSTEAPEGTALMLECHVTGLPVPTISWFKGDQSIDNSSDYVITKINNSCCLKIRKLTKDHSSQYTCKATNPGGEATSSATLQVVSVKKPQFTEYLKDTSVSEGKGVVLLARFTGEPAPQIQWLRNDAQILPSAIFKIVVEANYTALEIKEVFPEDAGTYVVIARNLGGEARTSGLLSIDGLAVNGSMSAKAPSKPYFTQQLQNKDVQEGSRAHFKCEVAGFPEPEIIWYHNDKVLKDTKDFELNFDGERCVLIIREVYLEDSGEYKCTAKNAHGSAHTTCRLIVEPLSELSDASVTLPGDVVPPKFTQLLKDIEGVEGELIRFDCRVIGHPTPAIKWYRGRNQIQSSADFQLSSERELHSLTIPEVFKEDAGNYMVRATNAAGTAKCYASLIIKQSADKHMMKTRLVEASHSM
jgi:titin